MKELINEIIELESPIVVRTLKRQYLGNGYTYSVVYNEDEDKLLLIIYKGDGLLIKTVRVNTIDDIEQQLSAIIKDNNMVLDVNRHIQKEGVKA